MSNAARHADEAPQGLALLPGDLTEEQLLAAPVTKDGTRTSGAQVAFRVADLDAAHQRAVAAGADVLHAPQAQPWGRSSRYRDPDGNVIELTQPL